MISAIYLKDKDWYGERFTRILKEDYRSYIIKFLDNNDESILTVYMNIGGVSYTISKNENGIKAHISILSTSGRSRLTRDYRCAENEIIELLNKLETLLNNVSLGS